MTKQRNDEHRRRTPRQARSRETREAIVEAAARLFASEGLAGATTARIAKLAGVSPGSMYQYFPSKESLVQAIFERESERQFARFVAIVDAQGGDGDPAVIRAFVADFVDVVQADRDLNRVLLEELPRVSGVAGMRPIEATITQTVRALLMSMRDRIQPRDLEMASLILVRTVRYSVIALLEEPVEDAAREAFIDELSDVITAYLLAPRAWRSAEATADAAGGG